MQKQLRSSARCLAALLLEIIGKAFRFSGVFKLWIRWRKGWYAIMYHKPARSLFKKHLQFFKKYFEIVPIGEMERCSDGWRRKDRPMLCVTFDDGYKHICEELYEVLARHSIPFAIFLSTENVQRQNCFWWDLYEVVKRERGVKIRGMKGLRSDVREALLTSQGPAQQNSDYLRHHLPLSWDDLRCMYGSGLLTVGDHGYRHTSMTLLSQEEVIDECNQSLGLIRSQLGVVANYFSYPNGDFSLATERCLREMGYRLVFTTLPGRNDALTNPHFLRRIEADEAGVGILVLKIMGLYSLLTGNRTERYLKKRGAPVKEATKRCKSTVKEVLENADYWWDRQIDNRLGDYLEGKHRRLIDEATKILGLRAERVVLDYGCGSGTWSLYLHNQGYKTIGIDVNMEALKIYQRRIPAADTRLTEMTQSSLPVVDSSVDAIIVISLSQMFLCPWFLSEAKRVLKPGGVLVGTLQNRVSWRGVAQSIKARMLGTQNPFQLSFENFKNNAEQEGFVFRILERLRLDSNCLALERERSHPVHGPNGDGAHAGARQPPQPKRWIRCSEEELISAGCTMDETERRTEVLVCLFERLERQQVPYCVLKNYGGLPRSLNSQDVDLMVEATDLRKIRAILGDLRRSLDIKKILYHRRGNVNRFELFDGIERPAPLLIVEFWTGIEWYCFPIIMPQDILVKRTKVRQFYICSLVHTALICWLVPFLYGGQMKERYVEQFKDVTANEKEGLAEELRKIFGEILGLRIFGRMQKGELGMEDLRRAVQLRIAVMAFPRYHALPVKLLYRLAWDVVKERL